MYLFLIQYDLELPLVNELKYFIEIINGNPIDKANIQEGLDVIKILEMATKSLSLLTITDKPSVPILNST